jgi:hypothetical protein
MCRATNLLICTILRLASLSSCFQYATVRLSNMASQQAGVSLQGNLVKVQFCILLTKDFSGSTITMCRYLYLGPDENLCSSSDLAGPTEVCVYTRAIHTTSRLANRRTHLSGQTNGMHSPMFAISQTTCDGDRWKCSSVRKRYADVQN